MKNEHILNLKGVYGLSETTDGDLINWQNQGLPQIY
jgi:hypothetical protein